MKTTKASPQGTDRKTAAVVGVLFIIGTVTGVIAAIIGKPILDRQAISPTFHPMRAKSELWHSYYS